MERSDFKVAREYFSERGSSNRFAVNIDDILIIVFHVII